MDKISKAVRSSNMRAIRCKGMKPELLVRRLVFRLGYRFRLHAKQLPGKPDLVFKGRGKIIFVHGCFWHQHGCKPSQTPQSNIDFWQRKLVRNVQRDSEHLARLKAEGWRVLVIWECETGNDRKLALRLRRFLG